MDPRVPTTSDSNKIDANNDIEIGLRTETISQAKAVASGLNPLSPVHLTLQRLSVQRNHSTG